MQNSNLKIQLGKYSSGGAQTLVVFATKDKSGKPSTPKLSPAIAKLLSAATESHVFSGERKETTFFREANADGFKHVLFVGLGASANLEPESLRLASAYVVGSLRANKVATAALWLDSAAKGAKDAGAMTEALVEGLRLSVYDYVDFKNKHKKEQGKKAEGHGSLSELHLVTTAAPSAAHKKAVERAEIISECQNFARWLGDAPGSFITPSELANQAIRAAKGTNLKVTVWDKARIRKENFGGLLAVSQGSDQEPRFIIMEYKGAAASRKPVCFVGKGLTFDSGGISIKPSQSMEEMKYDMCGGAAVIAAMAAIARLKLKVNVIGLVPATENMSGGSALKPGDIYFARNGKSVEVFNTDAEGRLILGDALAYASELKPAAIFDVATLTGAITIALGNTHTGVFMRDKKIWKNIQDAAAKSAEWVWQMPLVDFHFEDMKGIHADLCNISMGRLAGSSTAAAFLAEFVDKDIPWAHFDIAGTAWNVHGRFPYHPKKSASGVMVRTFIELAQNC